MGRSRSPVHHRRQEKEQEKRDRSRSRDSSSESDLSSDWDRERRDNIYSNRSTDRQSRSASSERASTSTTDKDRLNQRQSNDLPQSKNDFFPSKDDSLQLEKELQAKKDLIRSQDDLFKAVKNKLIRSQDDLFKAVKDKLIRSIDNLSQAENDPVRCKDDVSQAKDRLIRRKDELLQVKDDLIRLQDDNIRRLEAIIEHEKQEKSRSIAQLEAQLLDYEHKLNCRGALDKFQDRHAPGVRLPSKAERTEIWERIVERDVNLRQKLESLEGFKSDSKHVIPAAIAKLVSQFYERLSADVRLDPSSKLRCKINKRLCSKWEVGFMVEICKELPLAYEIVDMPIQ